MSLCDTCAIPGSCCRYFALNGKSWSDRPLLEAIVAVQEHGGGYHPFAPLLRRPDGSILWWCQNLGRDGRCMDYENRPFTCRDFEPGSDRLCVHGPQGPELDIGEMHMPLRPIRPELPDDERKAP